MKFSAFVLGNATNPLKRGEPHVVVPAAVRLLEEFPSYTVAVRRTDVTRGHSHHLRNHGTTWSVVTVSSGIWPRNPDAEAEERSEILTVLHNLQIPTTTQENSA